MRPSLLKGIRPAFRVWLLSLFSLCCLRLLILALFPAARPLIRPWWILSLIILPLVPTILVYLRHLKPNPVFAKDLREGVAEGITVDARDAIEIKDILSKPVADERMANRIAVMVFGKTIAFVIYSFLSMFIMTAVGMLGQLWMPFKTAWSWAIAVFCICEVILVFMVAKGWLPGTKYVFPIGESFSETQFAFVANLVAGVSMLVARGESGEAFRWLINSAVLVCVLVYFVTKSIVMRKIRFKVLMAGILPVAQFFL